MFFHIKELQYPARCEKPDPLLAKRVQEILAGKFGEMTVAMQYLFQGWNLRSDVDSKYKDLLLDTGTEELAHVEIVATLIARLLDNAPWKDQEIIAAQNPIVAAILGGMNPQHAIFAGLGALPTDSVGYPWNGRYVTATGNLLTDLRDNLAKESGGRTETVRVYESTIDAGVRDTLAFLIARDTMHQNQWAAAIAELEAKEGFVAPGTFPQECENREFSYKFFNLSRGEASARGRWAHGPTPDSKGVFQYIACPLPVGDRPQLPPAPPYIHDTPPHVLNNHISVPPMK
ncbi:manganese catalase family protein [Paenibacillus xerothermodurans]|uniref:Manganese catalase family protein n=1 Tax=Paenibacillus xerothermodurans TaxID=1977292 RepID=A0A2W1NPM4_PAEXE|nr:manganese catalase family protein [Paenibacillus xerothermodurans]PZE19676.1 manganese catalase family protein [Paenibacillus xerothermodurans]